MSKEKINYTYNKKLPILKKGWKGNIKINHQFFNDPIVEKPPLLNVLKWKFSRNPQKKEKQKDTFKLQVIPLNDFNKTVDKIVWLGHASFLITINGVSLITDPCFYDLPMTKRKVSLPCPIENLQQLDYLLLSHDHRDHFDQKSIQQIIQNNPTIEALTALNIPKLFKKYKLDSIAIQEAAWYQAYEISKNIRIIFLPAKHWGRRGLNDFNKNLWGSFLIIAGDTKIFFAGDTAYSSIFKDIQAEFGNMDICMLPIAAYSPRYMMETSHCTPEEAFLIFNDLGGKTFIPMHYGTYDLSDEPLGEPIKRLNKCFDNNKYALKELAVGELFLI